MSDFTVEQKLELVRQVRSRNRRNRVDLGRREDLLYGFHSADRDKYGEGYGAGYALERYRDAYGDGDEDLYGEEYSGYKKGNGDDSVSGFRLRFLFSLGMFLLVIFLDLGHRTLAGMSSGEIFDRIAQDYAADFFNDSPAPQ